MPKRTDLKKIMVLGAGPIVVGQGCEFDYSGTQACKALRREGYQVVLINSNPATIMTDPDVSDRTYIEPITLEACEAILERERPQAILPTVGGQTALNMALALEASGALVKFGVELLGANLTAIKKAEDRALFKESALKVGLDLPKSCIVTDIASALEAGQTLGFPIVLRPAFTLGGAGGGIAYNLEEYKRKIAYALELSPARQVLVEESVLGWKEYELEVVRDRNDNVIIVCSIENLDPMGVHTGDSITVAPALTLSDREYQRMRTASIALIREIGVETGGCNVQFAVCPKTGRMIVIEMNPRVSRSSALASKATGFPIAKIATQLSLGYTLDELRNDITGTTPASFEPALDYVVVKAPRFDFEKFPDADPTLTTQMKSVGEALAIGRTFEEAFQKVLRSLETKRSGFHGSGTQDLDAVRRKLATPNAERIFALADALTLGVGVSELARITGIQPWFLERMASIVAFDQAARTEFAPSQEGFLEAKRLGFSDAQIAHWAPFFEQSAGRGEARVREARLACGVLRSYHQIDTCAAEFEASTPYLYSSFDTQSDAAPSQQKKIVIIGGGPNRIGQGIEFDYCCVHGAQALRADGFEVVMLNCNPSTVSTDYDTSDRLYLEPLTLEHVLDVCARENPVGVVIQLGGHTPLSLAAGLRAAGVPILGTSSDDIDRAEDRLRFGEVLKKLNIPAPDWGTARTFEDCVQASERVGFPVLLRPSYVLGGRAMEIVYDRTHLEELFRDAVRVSPDHPVLIDKYLEDAVEIDVDCLSDGAECVIAGIMEHVEEAGIHSGDSSCVLPPPTLRRDQTDKVIEHARALAKELQVVGLMNIQFAVRNDRVYVLEANPRASRTVPFASKATGVPWAKMAARVLGGKSLRELGLDPARDYWKTTHFSVKESVFPFTKFLGSDIVRGPEMRSTGEVMGIDADFGLAYAKSQLGAHGKLARSGKLFFSVKNKDKRQAVFVAKELVSLGFTLVATEGTAHALKTGGLAVEVIGKVHEPRPNILDAIADGQIAMIMNTPVGKGPRSDDYEIRRAAVLKGVHVVTTFSGMMATSNALSSLAKMPFAVKTMQEYAQDSLK
jgi:carbamoyl-phosphate synthase large subunit